MVKIEARQPKTGIVKEFIIDDADADFVAQFTWRLNADGYPTTTLSVGKPRRGRPIGVARLLLGVSDPRIHVDHANGDILDSRRLNIRPATYSQNQANRRRLTTNTSGFRGVTWHRGVCKWQAAIKVMGVNHYLGLFESVDVAGAAYQEAADRFFGEYAAHNSRGAA